MKSTILILAALTVSAAANGIYQDGWIDLNKNKKKDPYEDPAQPTRKRAADLLARMSADEKIGQLMQAHRQPDTETAEADALRQGRIGSFLDGSELIENSGTRNRVQRVAVEESRLGIPLIFGHDSIHGFRTIFPIPLAMACAWEPELFEWTQTVSARETAAVGINWTFAPMVDLARDPRWGRIAESFGEDPWLGGLYAAACVRGFQGTNPAQPDRVAACLKHYVGYGAAEGGRDYNTTEISEYTLRNFYLPQFKAGVDAGALTVMSAFNCLSGVPATANRHTLTTILREEWKFPGFVVSDWTSVDELTPHGVAADAAEAARLALTAGVDMEMVSTNFATLKAQLNRGLVEPEILDEAVRRVLCVKFKTGLFERPFVDESLAPSAFLRPDALALARLAAARSCVLLKNDNGILPLSTRIQKVALIGPFADAPGELLGCWAARGRAGDVISLAAALRSRLPDAELAIARGCEPTSRGKVVHELSGVAVETAPAVADDADRTNLVAAANIAAAADAVILALGEPAGWSGENASRSTLDLPGRQMELFDAVVAAGKPVVVVLINGRPLAIPQLHERAAAILEAWNPGVQGGNGIVDVLFGETNPAGRLTASFPRQVGQVPVHYNHFNTGRPKLGEYVDGPRDPLYPFGFGLTYTTFEYGSVELNAPQGFRVGGTFWAHAKVKNTGARAGSEVVQLYIQDIAAAAGPRPVRELKGFQKVRLNPGGSRQVEFAITDRELGYFDASGRWRVEPGRFRVWIARDSASGESVEFELGAARP